MPFWKEYILNIMTVSLICSIIRQIVPESSQKELIHIVCGVLLTVIILQPVTDIRLEDIAEIHVIETESADAMVVMGKESADKLKRQYITDQCQAYILDKAKAMDAEILPMVTVDESFLPVFAEIHGEVSPEIQKKLEQLLISEMGITKENQLWIGNPEGSD